jgi:hypothetical protein
MARVQILAAMLLLLLLLLLVLFATREQPHMQSAVHLLQFASGS